MWLLSLVYESGELSVHGIFIIQLELQSNLSSKLLHIQHAFDCIYKLAGFMRIYMWMGKHIHLR